MRCILLGFAALGGLMLIDPSESSRAAALMILGILAACFAAWEWLLTRTYVALTTTGVELHQLGFELRAVWPDVVALSLRRGREGFIVSAPIEGSGAARLAALRRVGTLSSPMYDDVQRELLRERRFIPIEAFAWHARHGALEEEVARLAPHVRISDEAIP